MKSNGDEEGVDAEIQKGRQVMHVKRENNSSKPSSPSGKDIVIEREVPFLTSTERFSMEINTNEHSSTQNQEDQLKSAKAKVGEVREENERLKQLLAQMVKDYQSLQVHFLNILQKEEAKKSNDTSTTHQETEEPAELVSLSLGRSSSEPKNDHEKKNSKVINGKEDENLNEGLALGLDCRFELNSTEPEKNPSSENSSDELKEEEPTEMWPPNKIMKTVRSGDEEILQQTHLKKARVSVRARCDTPTMNDGCQWRKYGQKIAKGNPCPRAYYRCTVSPTCPVRKQVQRWAEDMSILITTYEGTHNHPLPLSATAMASTTSAAASMLQCRSSTTSPPLGTSLSAPNSTSTFANLQGLNSTFFQNAKPYQFYFPNSSISSSNSHPTVVLDLTAPATSSHLNRLPSAPRYYSTTCLNFSNPSSANNFLEPNTPQTAWSSGYSSYGTLSYNKNLNGSLNLGKQTPQEHIFHPYTDMSTPPQGPQQSLTETIAATTKVIASNPNFQSALAAAITSYIGSGGGSKAQQNLGVGENHGLNLKWSESLPVTVACSSADNGVGCPSSFLNKLLSSHPQQQGNISKLPPPLTLSTSNTASGSPARTKN